MTFIEADGEPQLNQFDPVKSSSRPQARVEAIDFPHGSYESLRRPKTVSQNCQQPGAARPSKASANSNGGVDVTGLEESRATAKFTNQSMTYLDGTSIDEFSHEAEALGEHPDRSHPGSTTVPVSEGLIMISEGRRRIEEAAGRTEVTAGEMGKGADGRKGSKEVFSPAFGEDHEPPMSRKALCADDENDDDLNSSWEKAVSDIEARKKQLLKQRDEKESP